MHGLDAEALAKNIEGDEFAVERAKGKPEPFGQEPRRQVRQNTLVNP
jgi:hypothetical protein